MDPDEKCLAAYGHVLKILEMNQDNYFKRTQILMIVIQSVLFAAFVKILSVKPEILRAFVPFFAEKSVVPHRMVLIILTVLGARSAGVWMRLIHRQRGVLNLCKSYMSSIETVLMKFGVPLGYWKHEGTVSHRPGEDRDEHMVKCTISENNEWSPAKAAWLPYKTGKEFKILLTETEENVAKALRWLWILVSIALVILFILSIVCQ